MCAICEAAAQGRATFDRAAGEGLIETLAAGDKPEYSLDQVIATLSRNGYKWTTTNVLFDFDTGSRAPTDEQKVMARLAFDSIADVIPLKFVEQAVPAVGSITIAQVADLGSGVWGQASTSRIGGKITGSDIEVSAAAAGTRAWFVGGYNFQALMHEIMHAIGIPHPGNYNASATSTITYAKDAVYAQDSRQYTIMSYFDPVNTGASYATVGQYGGVFSPMTPQLHDIAVLQSIYGANMQSRVGDTVYGYNSNAGRLAYDFTEQAKLITAPNGDVFRPVPVMTIWDAGGNDTLDLSGAPSAVTLDLHEGAFSSTHGMASNIAIAFGAAIENAIAGAYADQVTGNAGDNLVLGLAGNDTLKGDEGNDRLYGGDGDDLVLGEGGADTVYAGLGTDTVYGGAGADVLISQEGDDFIDGGDGDDAADGGAGADTVRGDLGNDYLRGGAGVDSVYGDAGSDLLYGDEGDDRVEGGDGDDIVYAGDGADSVLGGLGVDILIGQLGADTLNGEDGDDLMDGEAGDDQVYGGAGHDYLAGGADRDLLVGGAGNDTVYAGDDDDAAQGEDGDDLLVGHAGDDSLNGGAGADRIDGADGNDTVFGGADGDYVRGWTGHDVINGGDGDDRLDCDDGDDVAAGEAGTDTLYGGLGNDTLVGGDGNDLLIGQDGHDRINAGSGADAVDGGAGDDQVFAGAGADLLIGREGSDTLYGQDGDDSMFAGDADDALVGGLGVDSYHGGAGADRFIFESRLDSTGTYDLIRDFSAADGDAIDLTAVDANANTAGDQAFFFVAALTGVAGQATLTYDSVAGQTKFEADTDGDGVADFGVLLTGEVTTATGWWL